MTNTFTIDAEALNAVINDNRPSTHGINFGMLEMLELWAEKEWAKKEKGLPSEWDQDTWMTKRGEEVTGTACGTACCIAGKAILVTPGVEWAEYNYTGDDLTTYAPVSVLDMEEDVSMEDVLMPEAMVPADVREDYELIEQNGNRSYRMGASDAGRIILGLNGSESGVLFSGGNDLDDIKQIMSDIRSGVYRRNRRSVNIPTVQVENCGMGAQQYVLSLLPEDKQRTFYHTYGRCIEPAGHDVATVPHRFS